MITEKGVILNEGCLAAEGEQDEQKKMKMQLEKIDAMLKIPYDEEDDDSALQPTARARNKARIRGIS